MGVVNVTPDSFSDGGLFLDPQRAIAHGRRAVRRGRRHPRRRRRVDPARAPAPSAPRSSWSGSGRWSQGSPLARAMRRSRSTPRRLRWRPRRSTPGPTIVNDVTALRADPELAGLCAERAVHGGAHAHAGHPRTMQEDPRYDDVVDDVRAFLAERIEAAVAAGIDERRIWVDPGHRLRQDRGAQPRAAAPARRARGARAPDRDRHLAQELPRVSSPAARSAERVGGTIASNVLALAAGAEVFRVHDVAEAAPGSRCRRGHPRSRGVARRGR